MRVVRRLLRVSQRAQSFNDVVLRIRLARIDHVVDFADTAEMRMIAFSALCRNPAVVTIGIAIEASITKISAEQSEFPKMVGDVFADVSNGAIGAHNDLVIFCLWGCGRVHRRTG